MAAAEACFDGGHWEAAVSRGYYAVYHLVVELLGVRRGIEAGKRQHDTLVNLFVDEFCRRGYYFRQRVAGC